ncbi:MAG: hypothetical protein IPH88_00085 [Bacteroidales bacterium]|nr:hypothetical protein [Bacteroidales bacterium]
MKTISGLILFACILLLTSGRLEAQNMREGDNVIDCLGKSVDSDLVNLLMSAYKMKDDIPGVKAGKGLTFYAPSGYVQRITFQNNKMYGHFAGNLPFGLSLNDNIKDLRQKFPKATETEDYFKFYSGKCSVEIKFTSAKKKSIEFVSVL